MGKETIGFIGLGMLGRPMAANLLADGYRVRVYNRNADKAAALAGKGAVVVSSPAQTALPGGVVMSCVADDAALEAVIGAGDELAERLADGGVHVSMSTVLPETAEMLVLRHAACGGHYVAAPVMGRPDAVRARGQSYFVAGDPEAKDRVRPLLEKLGARVFDFGENPADANTVKLAANLLIAASIEAMAEAFALVEKCGADPAPLHEALVATLFDCPIYRNYGRQMLDAAYREPRFRMALGLKDMRLVNRTADAAGMPMRLAALLKDRLQAGVAHGRGGWDWTGIAAEVREEAGL